MPATASKPKLSFLSRMIRSRRVRAFIVASVIVHAGLALWLAYSPKARTWLFGGGPAVQSDLAEWEIQKGIDRLFEAHRERLRTTAVQLAKVRDQINALSKSKLATMRQQDIDRKKEYDAAAATRPMAEKFHIRIDSEPPALTFPALPDMTALDVVELYNLHKPIEMDAGKAYERVRALQLAELPEDPIPLSKALGVSRVPIPERRSIDITKLDRNITTLLDGKFDQLRQELSETTLEAENMVTAARQWLEAAIRIEEERSTLLGENIIRYVPPPVPYYGEIINKKHLRQTDLRRLINPNVSLGTSLNEAAGAKAEWMALDKWYYVGPFTYAGAAARLDVLDRKFDPEREVNLDAAYPRPDGKPGQLTWRYRRMGPAFLEGGVRVEPYLKDNNTFSVWYFYTEVYSDADREVLTSIASDDYGVCRINGEKVYESPPETFPWVPFHQDSFQKVKLKKGYNKVLFKLENARGTTGFCVILQVDPNGPTPFKDGGPAAPAR